MNSVFLLMFMLSMFLILKFKKYFLLLLMSMEFMVLSVLLIFLFNVTDVNNEDYLIIIYLVFSVCEHVIGLIMIINSMNLLGNQVIMMNNLLY